MSYGLLVSQRTSVFIHFSTNMECSLVWEENVTIKISGSHSENGMASFLRLNEEVSITFFVRYLFWVTIHSLISGLLTTFSHMDTMLWSVWTLLVHPLYPTRPFIINPILMNFLHIQQIVSWLKWSLSQWYYVLHLW
jgi:hypothetical protein